MYNGIGFTDACDIEKIVENAFCVLSDIGVLVESDELCRLLIDGGEGHIFKKDQRICISRTLSQRLFLSGAVISAPPVAPTVSACAEVYEGWYLDPLTNAYRPWDKQALLSYCRLAKALPNVGRVSMLGYPLSDVPMGQKPLYEKLFGFLYGVEVGGSIWDTALCGPILEMWQAYADACKKPVQEVFGATVYLLTPLRFGHVEADQLLWFWRHGLQVGIGSLASLGLSVPVTLAGALAEQLAEQIFVGAVQQVLFGNFKFQVSGMVSVSDIRTSAFQYGRPEQVLLNSALADIATHYRLPFWGHGGLCDAKMPSFEAGVQKMGTAMGNLMKGHSAYLAAGLLSVDEVYSPVQMVLDDEAAGYLGRICKGFSVNAESLALDAMKEWTAEGIMPVESLHTAVHMRENIWVPSLFSAEMMNGWNHKTDLDRAKEKAVSLMAGEGPERQISEECERRLTAVIQKVTL